MQVQIKVRDTELNGVLSAIRAAGIRHVDLDQVEDGVQLTLTVAGDVAQVLRAVDGGKARAVAAAGYEALSQFASARARNRSGQFVPMRSAKGSHTMKRTGS